MEGRGCAAPLRIVPDWLWVNLSNRQFVLSRSRKSEPAEEVADVFTRKGGDRQGWDIGWTKIGQRPATGPVRGWFRRGAGACAVVSSSRRGDRHQHLHRVRHGPGDLLDCGRQ